MSPDPPATEGLLGRCRRGLRTLWAFERTVPQARSTHGPYLVLFLACLLVPFLIGLDPSRARPLSLFGLALPPGCPSQHWFRLECPGCGLTRSFVALTHGEWMLAWRYHRVGMLLYLYFALRLAAHAWLIVRPETAARPAFERAYNLSAWGMIALLLLNWGIGLAIGSNGG